MLTPVLCDKLEAGDRVGAGGRLRREGTYVYLWQIHADIRQKPAEYCKANILQ